MHSQNMDSKTRQTDHLGRCRQWHQNRRKDNPSQDYNSKGISHCHLWMKIGCIELECTQIQARCMIHSKTPLPMRVSSVRC